MIKRNKRTITITTIILLSLFSGAMIFAMASYFIDRKQTPITTSIAVGEVKPPREVKDIMTNNDGHLIISYNDGTTSDAGMVRGTNGDASVPSSAQLSAALIEYCSGGKCDAKMPTQEQVMLAVSQYCLGGICKGSNGTDATPITAKQIELAITSYCTDGRCKGATGISGTNGVNGKNGESPQLQCVTRLVNTVKTNFIATKLPSQPNASFIDLYELPTWAICDNPIDLTT